MKRISFRTQCLLAGSVFIVGVVIRARIGQSGLFYDDGMIVLRVAKNIAHGYGFCYNIGEHVQAATSLLWSLLAAAMWMISPTDSFFLMRAVGALMDSLAAAGLVLILLSGAPSRDGEKNYSADKIVSALVAGLFYATASTSALAAPSGLETGLYTLLIVLAFLAFVRSYIRIAVLISIVLVLVRPDGVLVAATFAAYVLLKDRRCLPFVAATYAVCGLLYLVGMYSYFHHILPQTVIAKQLFQRTAAGEWSTIIHHFFLGGAAPIGLFALLGAFEILRHRPELRILLFWCALYTACFATFSHWWAWYFPPVVLGYGACLGVGIELALRTVVSTLDGRLLRPAGISAAVLLAAVSSILTLRKAPLMGEAQTLRLERGQHVASLLTAASSSTDTVMLEPLGIIGFYTPRTFYDYPGLASPRTTDVLRSLDTEVSNVPDNPAVMKLLLAKVRPSILVLRQHEYETDLAGNALSSCHLFATVPVSSNRVTSVNAFCGDCNVTMYLLRCNPSA
jgi:hypothetical protein